MSTKKQEIHESSHIHEHEHEHGHPHTHEHEHGHHHENTKAVLNVCPVPSVIWKLYEP